MNDYRHDFKTGDRVKILTPAGGCYDGATGTVTEKLDAGMAPYPPGQEPVIAHFYKVRTDSPVDVGDGKLVPEDVHPHNQVFPEGTTLPNYWNIRKRR